MQQARNVEEELEIAIGRGHKFIDKAETFPFKAMNPISEELLLLVVHNCMELTLVIFLFSSQFSLSHRSS